MHFYVRCLDARDCIIVASYEYSESFDTSPNYVVFWLFVGPFIRIAVASRNLVLLRRLSSCTVASSDESKHKL
jgi:hypothetical protein